MWKILQENV